MTDKQWTILEALTWTEQRLERKGEDNPRLAAQMLTSHATGLSRIDLYINFDKPLSVRERALLREAITRRLANEPLQYIVGRAGFRHLELKVCPPVLIPRPETELLVELVSDFLIQACSSHPRVLDIGTGSGAIALALAQQNAEELGFLGCEHSGDARKCRLELRLDDLAEGLLATGTEYEGFDVVVSNPPYIPTAEYLTLPEEIRLFESREALDGGRDGLDVFRAIATQAHPLLKPGGLLALELHEDALESASTFLKDEGYSEIQLHADLTGRMRFVTARRENS